VTWFVYDRKNNALVHSHCRLVGVFSNESAGLQYSQT